MCSEAEGVHFCVCKDAGTKEFQEDVDADVQKLEEAWQARDGAELNRLSLAVGRSHYGPKKRNFRTLNGTIPTAAEWMAVWSKHGPEGGMEAMEIDWDDYKK